jgi:hypothetical protein
MIMNIIKSIKAFTRFRKYGHGLKESAEMACIFYKMIGLIKKHENTKS